MGTLCIILGFLFLIGCTGGGYLLTNFLANYQMMGQSLLKFIGFSSDSKAYIIIVGAFFVIGLLLCFNWLMVGFTARRCGQLKREVEDLDDEVRALKKKMKKLTSSSKKSAKAEEDESIDDMFGTDDEIED